MTSRRSATARAWASTRPDRNLVELAVAGDHEAFVTLVKRHDDRLRALAGRLLAGHHDRVDDALQDAYVNAFRALPRFRHDADFGTWLYRVAYNACIDELRRVERRPRPVDTSDAAWEWPATTPDPARVVSAAATAERALAAIPVDQRVAVVLVDGEGFDLHSASDILGVAAGTVASRLSRGRARLRRLIGEDNS